MAGEKLKLVLEAYVGFFQNQNRPHLTIDQLNQIVSMHGFVKLHRRKAEILKILDSLELMSPTRSTIRSAASSSLSPAAAGFAVVEVKRDVEAIGWQECPVVSLVTVGSQPAEPEKPSIASSLSAHLDRPSAMTGPKRAKKTKTV